MAIIKFFITDAWDLICVICAIGGICLIALANYLGL